jgi:hypothetical protein
MASAGEEAVQAVDTRPQTIIDYQKALVESRLLSADQIGPMVAEFTSKYFMKQLEMTQTPPPRASLGGSLVSGPLTSSDGELDFSGLSALSAYRFPVNPNGHDTGVSMGADFVKKVLARVLPGTEPPTAAVVVAALFDKEWLLVSDAKDQRMMIQFIIARTKQNGTRVRTHVLILFGEDPVSREDKKEFFISQIIFLFRSVIRTSVPG